MGTLDIPSLVLRALVLLRRAFLSGLGKDLHAIMVYLCSLKNPSSGKPGLGSHRNLGLSSLWGCPHPFLGYHPAAKGGAMRTT